jgi:hypothetical protein
MLNKNKNYEFWQAKAILSNEFLIFENSNIVIVIVFLRIFEVKT